MEIASLTLNLCFFSTQIPDKPEKCNKSTKGKLIAIKDRRGDVKLLICDKNEKIFRWKMIDGKICFFFSVTIFAMSLNSS